MMRYMKQRQQLVDFGKKMMAEGLTTGTGGNLSIVVPDEAAMLITPSGIAYNETKIEDIVLMDLDGNVLEGECKPSSEYHMHAIFYQNNPEIKSVVHTHSDFATAVACLQQDIEPFHYIIASVGDRVRCCGYQTFGTQALAEEAYRVMGNNKGILLGNHGVLAVGNSCSEAFSVAKDIEFLAKLKIRARAIGQPVLLSPEDIAVTQEKFANYGQPKKEFSKL